MTQPTAFFMAAIIIQDNCFETMHTQGLELIKMPASSNKRN
jgi:hypothetical protein